ncbi:MAG: hypothetical protein WCO56_22060 [Verrucomicrobiota bacterium]
MNYRELRRIRVKRATRKKWLLSLGAVSCFAGLLALFLAIRNRDLLLGADSSLLPFANSTGVPFYLKLFGAAGLLFTGFMCLRRELFHKRWRWRLYLLPLPVLGSLVALWADACLLGSPQDFLDHYIWLPITNALLSCLSFPLMKRKGLLRWLTLLALILPILFLIKVIYLMNIPMPIKPEYDS